MTSCAKNCVGRKSGSVCDPIEVKGVCKASASECITLEQIVDNYFDIYRGPLEQWLDSLTEDQNKDLWFTNFICGEANISKDPDDNKFCKNPHQFRMPSQTVKAAREVLEKAGLDEETDFEGILRKVIDAVRKDGVSEGVPNFGVLACYDFTLRYAYQRGIKPEYVYVHAGTAKGLKYLETYLGHKIEKIRDRKFGIKFKPQSLPPRLAKLIGLGGLHIEHFLCVYHKSLAKLCAKK